MITPRELKELYKQGENISAWLRREEGVAHNTREIIEVAYDLQSGSYVSAMDDPTISAHKREYAIEISKLIRSLCEPESILEAGVGEATTLSGVVKALGSTVASYGFDLSWSRVAVAREWLENQDVQNTVLCTGDLLNAPFASNSIDVVYTSHSIEPNGGSEEAILRELYRVAKRYLVLLEPG
ncbi:MAG: methyltransferase type 11, partial [Verrucomicrobia bacterium]